MVAPAAPVVAAAAAPKVFMTAGTIAGIGMNPTLMMAGAASMSGASVLKGAAIIAGAYFGILGVGVVVAVVAIVGAKMLK